jgi:hypothetical protein
MPNREGGSAFRRGATKHQIKKSDDESKMTNFVFCFCFLSSSLEKIQKEKGREETWERGNRFISSTRSLFLREETHQSHAHERTRRIINRTEHSNTLFVRSKRFYRCCSSSSSSSRNKRKIQKRTNF